MINNVDVSGWTEEEVKYHIAHLADKNKVTMELYKQLARKTEECEELKEKLEYKNKEYLAYDKSIQKWHKKYEEIYSELQAEMRGNK